MKGASSKPRRILGKLGETTPCAKAFAEMFAMEQRPH
jgi:hypothetical protein